MSGLITNLACNIACKMLAKIMQRGNGILIMTIKDGVLIWKSVTYADEYIDIIMTVNALQAVSALGEQEQFHKLIVKNNKDVIG